MKCKACGRNYKKLPEEELCFHCHYTKYKKHPKEWKKGEDKK